MPLLLVGIFLFLFVVIGAAATLGIGFVQHQRRNAIVGAIESRSARHVQVANEAFVLEKTGVDTLAFLDKSPVVRQARTLLQQAGVNWTVPQLLTGSMIGATAGLALGGRFPLLIFPSLSRTVIAIFLSALPWIVVRFKRNKRMAEIEQQFPDALDFLARSMRAGHAFTISLEMLGQETPEPLGQEIRTLYNEQNLGAPLEDALNNFGNRVPLIDVRFFVSTVLLQKQTGGNLSEILLRLSHVIRERFKVKGQVRAASAHGRITAGVLMAMPVVLTVGLSITSPDYLKGFVTDPDGKFLIVGAMVGQLLGYVFIRKIVNIKV